MDQGNDIDVKVTSGYINPGYQATNEYPINHNIDTGEETSVYSSEIKSTSDSTSGNGESSPITNDEGTTIGHRYKEYDGNGNLIKDDVVYDDYGTVRQIIGENGEVIGTEEKKYHGNDLNGAR